MSTIFLDVEAGDNCPYSMQLVFSGLEDPRPVRQVRLYLTSLQGDLYDVTGWDNEGEPCPAIGVKVEDSGQGFAFLVYGGDGGLRFRPAASPSPWSLIEPDQWAESHLVLSEAEDVVWE